MTTEFMNVDEAAELLKISKSHLYKLTFRNQIPFYKPGGKLLYFKREELIEWVEKGKIDVAEVPVDEIIRMLTNEHTISEHSMPDRKEV